MRLVFLLASVTSAMAADTGSGSGFSGSFSSGNGQGYGYGGSFSSDGPGPQGIPFNVNGLFGQYFDIFNRFNQGLTQTLQNQQNMFTPGGFGFPGGRPPFFGGGGTGGGGGGGGYGGSFSNFGRPSASGAFPTGQSSFSGGYGGGFSNLGGQGASASGFIGPGGTHQTAAVYPQNPNRPNVDTRFGDSSGGGNFGVFTSSQSLSSNLDGKPVNFHKATTTINDNGKVSTYTVQNP